MDRKEYRGLLISNFNIDNFAGYLNNNEDFPLVKADSAPFNQVFHVLTDKSLECWKDNPDFAVIWTCPEGVIESFNHIINYKTAPLDKIFKEVDEYSSLLLDICGRVKAVFIPSWVFPHYHRGFGMLDMKDGIGVSNTLMRMNLRLSENLGRSSNIYLLNTSRWVNIAGKKAFDPKVWYMGKIAFGNEVFIEAAKDTKSALRGVIGSSRKLIILDMDDILWGGILGDVGLENIILGGHDPVGEAYVDFQRALKSLTNRGILLAIASKNEEGTALEAIRHHPEMVLRTDDFAAWKINWQDKAQNIVDLVSSLNLGLQSAVFIDDNPVERARIREALPEVFVPEWPEDKMLYRSTLLSLHCFDQPSISKEDLERPMMYVTERQREDLKRKIGSFDEWLRSLKIRVKAEELNNIDIQRSAQLLNKTNQMNLTTRRMTESELAGWVKDGNRKLWTFRVMDKFSDSGLTGIISLEVNNNIGEIVDFVLSCRVLGRKIEEAMIYTVIKYAEFLRLDEIYAKYIPTPKNKVCLEFWKVSGFQYNEKENLFTWKMSSVYRPPENIQLEGNLYGQKYASQKYQ